MQAQGCLTFPRQNPFISNQSPLTIQLTKEGQQKNCGKKNKNTHFILFAFIFFYFFISSTVHRNQLIWITGFLFFLVEGVVRALKWPLCTSFPQLPALSAPFGVRATGPKIKMKKNNGGQCLCAPWLVALLHLRRCGHALDAPPAQISMLRLTTLTAALRSDELQPFQFAPWKTLSPTQHLPWQFNRGPGKVL